MILLHRTVRFSVNPGGALAPHEPDSGNGFAGRPSMRGLGRYYELDICCMGEVDRSTGYFMPISKVDQAVRESAIPLIAKACDECPETDPRDLLPDLTTMVNDALDGLLVSLRWRLTPYYCLEMMPNDTSTVLLKQRFDFAAAHRLHAPSLSDEENRKLFGKCNNPNYHGHNYHIEPEVAVDLNGEGERFSLQCLERIVDEVILRQFDHRNLNLDVPEFGLEAGVNPSVEYIAQVCYQRLVPAIELASSGGATLRRVTVWETDRTSCTYPA